MSGQAVPHMYFSSAVRRDPLQTLGAACNAKQQLYTSSLAILVSGIANVPIVWLNRA